MEALGIFGRKIARQIRGPIEEGERWRIEQGDKGHINRGRYYGTYKMPGWSESWI